MIHVVPVNDYFPHADHGIDFRCCPRVLTHDPETGQELGEVVVMHRAFDGRDVIQEAEQIISEGATE